MNKKEFLSALERSLSVLQEDELRDIVSEYEQHIDIKVAKGLTEEEAIADFGSFSELTAELLEAYHVRADYADKEQGRGASPDGKRGSGETKKTVPWAVVKHIALGIQKGARWMVRQAIRPFSWFYGKCRRYFELLRSKDAAGAYGDTEDRQGRDNLRGMSFGDTEYKDEYIDGEDWQEKGGQTDGKAEMPGNTRNHQTWSVGSENLESDDLPGRKIQPDNEASFTDKDRFRRRSWFGIRDRKQRQVHRRKGKGGMIVQSIGRGAVRIARWVADMAGFVLRTVWNCCWLLFSLMTAGFGLFCLYGLGVLVVLLTQGYPLTGVTLGCLGLVMCAFSASVIGITFLRRHRRSSVENRNYKSSGNNRDKINPKSTDGPAEGKVTEEEWLEEEWTEKDPEKDSEEGFAPDGSDQFNQLSEDQMRKYRKRGGEVTWVNCGV